MTRFVQTQKNGEKKVVVFSSVALAILPFVMAG